MSNYFELFNLPPSVDIDLVQLKARYQQLQKLTHPDRFASASEQEKRLYMQKNAQVNDAYHVLKSPVERIQHLLVLRGVELPDSNATMGDTAFLMQQMELREAIASADDETQLEDLIAQVMRAQATLQGLIAELVEDNSAESGQNAAIELTKLKFFTKLLHELEEKLNQKADNGN